MTHEQEEIIELKRSKSMLLKIIRKLESMIEELRDEPPR